MLVPDVVPGKVALEFKRTRDEKREPEDFARFPLVLSVFLWFS
jgi:hypothetical protein